MGTTVSRTSTCSVTLPPSVSLVVSIAEWTTVPGLLVLASLGLLTVVRTAHATLGSRSFRLASLRRTSRTLRARLATSWPRFLPSYLNRSPRRVPEQSPRRRLVAAPSSPQDRLAAAMNPLPPRAYAILALAENPPQRLVTALRRYQAELRTGPHVPDCPANDSAPRASPRASPRRGPPYL